MTLLARFLAHDYQIPICTSLKLTQRVFKKWKCRNDFVSPTKWNSADLLLQSLQKGEFQLYIATEQETESDVKFK